MRLLLLAVMAFVGACSAQPLPTPPIIVWDDHVPTPGPAAIAAQPVLDRGPNSWTLLPISPRGAAIGVDYRYEMPHCGIHSPIDVDGSFWDATRIDPNSVDFDGASGTIRLTTGDAATFVDAGGRKLHLVRHSGAKTFGGCA